MPDSRETRLTKAFILGYPVKHSRSPIIHNYWIRELGINAVYEKVEVMPQDIQSFLESLKSGSSGYVGGNVTIPHKEVAAAFADLPEDIVRDIGAANVLWIEDGKLHATNTDAAGFLASLDEEVPGWDLVNRVVVLGAGGASRSIVHALKSRAIPEINIVNRSLDRAQSLADTFGDTVHAHDFRSLPDVMDGAGFFVNTTSLGMNGEAVPLLSFEAMAKTAIVNDIIYTPMFTPIMKQAGEAGLRTVGGLGMLLHQAVPGFEKWFGQRPTVTDALRRLVTEDLAERT